MIESFLESLVRDLRLLVLSLEIYFLETGDQLDTAKFAFFSLIFDKLGIFFKLSSSKISIGHKSDLE